MYNNVEVGIWVRDRENKQNKGWSGWWRDVCEIYSNSEKGGLCTEFMRVVGNGAGTLFCKDNWVEKGVLGVKFNKLFRLCW